MGREAERKENGARIFCEIVLIVSTFKKLERSLSENDMATMERRNHPRFGHRALARIRGRNYRPPQAPAALRLQAHSSADAPSCST